MRLTQLLPTLFLFTLVILGTYPAYGQESKAKPNFLLVVTDDQGWWDVGVHGNKFINTPVMDQLARSGVNLKRFYAQPVCAPTRAGLLTGRYYLRTGVYNTRFGGDTMRGEEVTIAEILQQLGYRTGLIGKWHLGHYPGNRPMEQGFDEFFGFYHGHIERYDYSDQLVHNGKPVETRGYITDLLTDAAIEFIKKHHKEPFFCYLAYNAPHSPWIVGDAHGQQERGDKLISQYLDKKMPLRDARIYSMIERIDNNLGRLLQTLDDLNISENTIVIFMSDNGGVSRFYRAGLRGAKGSVYEGGVRIPCFVRWPGHFASGADVGAMASHLDILPTVCDLLHCPLPENRKIDGKSILPLLKNGKGKSPHQFLFHTWNRYFPTKEKGTAVQSHQYRLAGKQLFDLKTDPGEKKNIFNQKPQVVRKMQEALDRWFADVTEGQKYRPMAIPIGDPRANPVEIQASWAILDGKSVAYTFRAYDWDTIDSWNKPGESVHWNLNVLRPGRYRVTVSYGAETQSAGSEFAIGVGKDKLTAEVQPTPTPNVFTKRQLGTIELPKGPATLRVEVVSVRGGEMMRLNRIWLKRLDDKE